MPLPTWTVDETDLADMLRIAAYHMRRSARRRQAKGRCGRRAAKG
jgi:hypothetical protein